MTRTKARNNALSAGANRIEDPEPDVGIPMLTRGLRELHDNSCLCEVALVTMPDIDAARTDKPSVAMPSAVRTIAVVLFLATAISFLTGSSLLFPEVAWHRLWEWNRPAYAFLSQEHLTPIVGVLLLALGMVTAITASGLLRGERWAWWIAVAVFAVNGAGDLLTIAVRRDVVRGGSGVLIASLFLFLLMRSGTRRYFGERSP